MVVDMVAGMVAVITVVDITVAAMDITAMDIVATGIAAMATVIMATGTAVTVMVVVMAAVMATVTRGRCSPSAPNIVILQCWGRHGRLKTALSIAVLNTPTPPDKFNIPLPCLAPSWCDFSLILQLLLIPLLHCLRLKQLFCVLFAFRVV